MKNILILGTSLFDNLIYSKTPIQNQQCTKVKNYLIPGGSMFNVAHNCGLLNLPTSFYTILGNDSLSVNIQTTLINKNVNIYYKLVDQSTPIFTYIQDSEKTLKTSSITSDFHITNENEIPHDVLRHSEYLVTDNKDYELIIKIKKINNKIKIISSGYIPDNNHQYLYEGSILNKDEFIAQNHHTNYEKHCRSTQLKFIVITLASDGCYYYQNQISNICSATNKGIGYEIGCGDSFISGILYGIYHNYSFDQTIKLANKCANYTYNTPLNFNKEIVEITLTNKEDYD
ncbi:MAG: carbohydrate kinase family protein [Erysipelotrichaceae bacterium]